MASARTAIAIVGVATALAAATQALPAAPAVGDLDSLLAGPLAVVSLAPADLSLRTDYEDPDSFRLPLVDALLKNPRRTAAVAESLAAALDEGQRLAEAVDVAGRALSGDSRFGDHGVPPGIAEVWVVTFNQLAREIEGSGQASWWAREGFSALPASDLDLLLRDGPLLLDLNEEAETLGIDEAAAEEAATQTRTERVLDAASRVDRRALLEAAWGAASLADAVDGAALSRTFKHQRVELPPWDGSPVAEGDILGAYRLADGRPAVVGGAGPTRYLAPCGLIVDFGGDDIYLAGAGGNGGQSSTFALSVDMAGDDVYEGAGRFTLAGAALGAGILIDVAGDDVYRAGDFNLGAGFFGLGILDDRDGNDRYLGGCFTNGAGAFGLGILRDRAGRDLYQGSAFTQGFGFVGGLGLLDDRAGEDVYLCQPRFSDLLRDDTTTLSLGQGFAYGARPLGSGGIGLLVDGEGHDRYLAEVFAQGGAYWCGLGALVDRAGNDHYDGFNYVQGAGVHVAVAALWDGGGDDAYRAKGVSQGCGHDLAFGMLVDSAGDDRYDASDLSQGAGNANGIGLLVDLAGNDAMAVRIPTTSQGYGNLRRNYGSVGLLLNLGGTDRYLGGPAAEGKLWQVGEHGVGVDTEPEVVAALGRSQARRAQRAQTELGAGADETSRSSLPVAPSVLEPLEAKPAIAAPESIPSSVRALDFSRLFHRAAAGEPRFTRERDQARGEIVRRGRAVVPELVARLGTLVARERHAIKDLALLLGRKRVERALARAMAGADERAARTAAWCLERIEAQGVEKELAAAAKHPSWRVRAAALLALGRGGNQFTLPVLIAALEDSTGPVRQAAAHALGERAVRSRSRYGPALPGPLARAVPALVVLLDDSFYGARHSAARALGRAGPFATPALLEVASEAAPAQVDSGRRVLAAQALGEGGDQRAVPLLRRLSRAESPVLAAQALVALARLGESPAASDSIPESPVRLMSSLMSPLERATRLVMAEAEERARALDAGRESTPGALAPP